MWKTSIRKESWLKVVRGKGPFLPLLLGAVILHYMSLGIGRTAKVREHPEPLQMWLLLRADVGRGLRSI